MELARIQHRQGLQQRGWFLMWLEYSTVVTQRIGGAREEPRERNGSDGTIGGCSSEGTVGGEEREKKRTLAAGFRNEKREVGLNKFDKRMKSTPLLASIFHYFQMKSTPPLASTCLILGVQWWCR
uniref:Uncharacterized protein n=1 Tax=Nelumbo nucifera TaxID=4432 RepID=A0A822XP39_NELNU|nr:TPA_asm: hypothetical protein HUJ06_023530 [Nelumbo nucifera]